MARSSGWFAYSTHDRVTLRRSTGGARILARVRDILGFRQVGLNVAGWGAVLGPGALVGLVGGIALGRSLMVAVPAGAIVSWASALSADRWKWSRSECGYDLGDLRPDVMADLAARLDGRGIPFRIEVEEYEPGKPNQIVYTKMLDRRHVEAALQRARAL